ncbi:hypothetical protein GHT06_010702 [Daphnia sinensis]|uniref:Uncharacterized protein n=1 Tax=Daphnia sinensis TaxID=1820382 RepID=A0AAD5L0Z8_9CRUS|nr:hypothetical protein GHT06_010702 [Daphnia sinensis]
MSVELRMTHTNDLTYWKSVSFRLVFGGCEALAVIAINSERKPRTGEPRKISQANNG